jgi:hypothetical protein
VQRATAAATCFEFQGNHIIILAPLNAQVSVVHAC